MDGSLAILLASVEIRPPVPTQCVQHYDIINRSALISPNPDLLQYFPSPKIKLFQWVFSFPLLKPVKSIFLYFSSTPTYLNCCLILGSAFRVHPRSMWVIPTSLLPSCSQPPFSSPCPSEQSPCWRLALFHANSSQRNQTDF